MAYYFQSMHLYRIFPFHLSGHDPSPVHSNIVFIVRLILSCVRLRERVLVPLSEHKNTHSSIKVRTFQMTVGV